MERNRVYMFDELVSAPLPSKAEVFAAELEKAVFRREYEAAQRQRIRDRAAWSPAERAAWEAAEIEAERAAIERGPIGAAIERERAQARLYPRRRLAGADGFDNDSDDME